MCTMKLHVALIFFWKLTWGASNEKIKGKKKYGKYSALQRWYCSLTDTANTVPHIEMEDKHSGGVGSCGCVCMCACVFRVRQTWGKNLAPLTYHAKLFGLWLSAALDLPACMGTERKDLISDPTPARCWLIWAHSKALNNWSRPTPNKLWCCREHFKSLYYWETNGESHMQLPHPLFPYLSKFECKEKILWAWNARSGA